MGVTSGLLCEASPAVTPLRGHGPAVGYVPMIRCCWLSAAAHAAASGLLPDDTCQPTWLQLAGSLAACTQQPPQECDGDASAAACGIDGDTTSCVGIVRSRPKSLSVTTLRRLSLCNESVALLLLLASSVPVGMSASAVDCDVPELLGCVLASEIADALCCAIRRRRR